MRDIRAVKPASGPWGCLIWRELTLVSRTTAFWVAGGGYVATLTAFVVVWGDGIPIAGSGTNWDQFMAVRNAMLLAILPWVAVRCGGTTAREVTALAAATASAPSHLLIAKWIALAGTLTGFALFALPVVVLMRDVAVVTVATAIVTSVPILGLAALVAALTAATTMLFVRPLHGWMIVALLTIAAGRLIPLVPESMPVWLLIAAGILGPSALSADRKLTYMTEERA